MLRAGTIGLQWEGSLLETATSLKRKRIVDFFSGTNSFYPHFVKCPPVQVSGGKIINKIEVTQIQSCYEDEWKKRKKVATDKLCLRLTNQKHQETSIRQRRLNRKIEKKKIHVTRFISGKYFLRQNNVFCFFLLMEYIRVVDGTKN